MRLQLDARVERDGRADLNWKWRQQAGGALIAGGEMTGGRPWHLRCERLQWAPRWLWRSRLQSLVVLIVTVLASGVASAHEGPLMMPPNGEYTIRWYQPHGDIPVQDWEVLVVPGGRASDAFFTDARAVPDDSCWSLDVPVSEAAEVRIRALSGSQQSPWSRVTMVPEPGFEAGLCLAAGALLGLGRNARRRGLAAPARAATRGA